MTERQNTHPVTPDIEHREGIVEVYDWNGKYLGCMGDERWQRLLRDDANTAPWSVLSQPARRDRLVP